MKHLVLGSSGQIGSNLTHYLRILKQEEVFSWATMIIEFYFGAQLAKK